jgi:hypothetical protein
MNYFYMVLKVDDSYYTFQTYQTYLRYIEIRELLVKILQQRQLLREIAPNKNKRIGPDFKLTHDRFYSK